MGQAAAWKGVRLKRLICLSLSAVIVVGLLFAVAFIMIPSLRASGNECVRNVPAYVEKIEQWWTNVVQLAAKYNAALPEYAIDAEALTENHRFYQLRRNRRVCRKRRKRRRFRCSDAA